ncbi:MAG: helix-turn-helix domain-containing protein, partial [Methanomassiliicoccales archaeon]
MTEVVLAVTMPDSWVRQISERHDVSVRILDCIPTANEGGRSLFEIEAGSADPEAVLESMRAHPDIERVDVTAIEEDRILGSVVVRKCSSCRMIMQSKCFLQGARSLKDGRIELRVVGGVEGSLQDLLNKLRQDGCTVDLQRVSRGDAETAVTHRQEAVIRKAMEMGYFDYPRRGGLKELAQEMGVSQSTVAEVLQRG